jgi:hypothetical protein
MLRILLSIALVLGRSAPAWAEENLRTRLDNARVCYAAVDLACAERELAAARQELTALRRELAVEVLSLSAETALADHRQGDAREHLARLLGLFPEFRATGWPPAWQEVLEEVRRALPDRDPPELRVTVPGQLGAGEPLVVRVAAKDRSGVGKVRLFWAGPAPGHQELVTRDGRVWEGRLETRGLAGRTLDLWIEAHDLDGNGPARQGTPTDPIRVAIAPEAEPEAYQTWWFWTVLAVGAAGLVGGIVLLSQPAEPATLVKHGALEVRIAWPPSN